MSAVTTWPGGIPINDTFYSLQDPRLANVLRGSSLSGFGAATATWLTMNTPADFVSAWEKCPPLVSIICNKAQADINGRVSFFKAGTDEMIKPTEHNKTVKALVALMRKPNPMQTWRQFRAQQTIYKQLFGICPVLMVKSVGFDTPKMMWNIPPQLVKVTTSGKLFYQSDMSGIITKVTVTYNGEEKELPVEDLVFLRDQTVSLNNELIPDSRLKTLSYPISNIVAAYEAANVLITKRGAIGILSNIGKDGYGSTPITYDQKNMLQEDLQKYGMSHNQWQYIITEASLQWQQIGVNSRDLMLLETIEDATQQLCDVYGHPFELLSSNKGTTFANKAEAKASLYQDTIIPEANADAEVYSEYFKLSAGQVDMRMTFDHVEVLQKSEKEEAEGRKATNEAFKIEYEAGAITLDDWREKNGLERMNTEPFTLYKWQMGKYSIDNGLMPDPMAVEQLKAKNDAPEN